MLSNNPPLTHGTAFNCGRELLRMEAVFGGGASGAAMAAALQAGGAIT